MSDERIRRVFADAGLRGWVHARSVAGGESDVAVDADDPVPLASVFKLVVLVAFARAADAGDFDPVARTTLRPTGRTGASPGVSAMRDAVTLSWRDAVVSMVTLSDNAATDAVYARVGPARIAETVAALGLDRTVVLEDAHGQVAGLLRDTGAGSAAEAFAALGDPDRPLEPVGYDPLRSSASTARNLTSVLAAVWSDTAASPDQCAFARKALAGSAGPYRLRLGFASDRVELANKTGTLGALRHDVGVVRFRGEEPYAVAVLTRSARADLILPAADAAIGAAARRAVDALRLGPDRPVAGPSVQSRRPTSSAAV